MKLRGQRKVKVEREAAWKGKGRKRPADPNHRCAREHRCVEDDDGVAMCQSRATAIELHRGEQAVVKRFDEYACPHYDGPMMSTTLFATLQGKCGAAIWYHERPWGPLLSSKRREYLELGCACLP